jgi:pyridoxal phosphate enzyme (YggS family)
MDYLEIRRRIDTASQRAGRSATLLAVSKTKPADAVRALAAQGQHAFGENYVQEGLAKQRELADLNLEWHLIGPLQSNKCRDVAENFAWLQTLDRVKLIDLLDRFRSTSLPPLNVLIQVNIDDEAGKSGCTVEEIAPLADRVAQSSRLKLRGLMAIPQPSSDLDVPRKAFRRMRELFDALKARHSSVDTLSMGMSDDFELAIEEGATMVRIGTALFGQR